MAASESATCDCQNPDGAGVRHVSMECPVHNDLPVCTCGRPVEPGFLLCLSCWQEFHKDEQPPMPCSEAHETTAPDALTLADQAFANARALVDTVTVSAPAYSLGGSVIGHYSVTLPGQSCEASGWRDVGLVWCDRMASGTAMANARDRPRKDGNARLRNEGHG